MKNAASILVIALLVVGCSDKNVDVVRNSYPANSKYKYSQVLDKREICISPKWTSNIDERGAIAVKYECSFVSQDAAIQKVMSRKVDEVSRHAEYLDKKFNDTLGFIVTKINKISNDDYIERTEFSRQLSAQEVAVRKEEKARENTAELQDLKVKLEKINAFKGRYFSEIEKYVAEDKSSITSTYTNKFIIKQILTFDISSDAPKIVLMEFTVNDLKFRGNFDDMKLLAFEFVAPADSSLQELWRERIQSQLSALYDVKIAKFPLKCDFDQGCPAEK